MSAVSITWSLEQASAILGRKNLSLSVRLKVAMVRNQNSGSSISVKCFTFEPSEQGTKPFHSRFGFAFRFLLLRLTTFSKNPALITGRSPSHHK